jgi:hypothetical protein
MSAARRRLPDRRASETFTLECAGLQYTATISRFDDGRLGEIFLTNHKAGSAADTAARDPRPFARSPCNSVPMSRPSVRRFALTAAATRAARSAPRSTCVILREFW